MAKKNAARHKVDNPFCRATGRDQQRHRQPLYCVTWCDDIHVDDEGTQYRYLATCGSKQLTIYEVEKDNPKGEFDAIQSFRDEDKEEHFYACVFGGRSKYWASKVSTSNQEDTSESLDNQLGSDRKGVGGSTCPINLDSSDTESSSVSSKGFEARKKRARTEEPSETLMLASERSGESNYVRAKGEEFSSVSGPQLLCVAGAGAIVKVIDPVQKRLVWSLKGHGSDIYDMKISPTNEYLLLSASVDESIRLWNLESFACVAIFAGQHGHREAVLSLSWHPKGGQFASSGIDKSIRLWKVWDTRVAEALQASQKWTPSETRDSFHPLCEQFPYFATYKVHLNFVDCVQFLGDMVLSKSTYNSLVLWMPNIPKSSTETASKSAAYCPPSDVIALRIFELDHCSIWFVRFSTDNMGKCLAVGNTHGEVDIWNIDDCKKRPNQTLKPTFNSTIRMLSFSPDGKTLIGCNDTGAICRWDEY
jgi:polycomb protein EED